MSREGAAARWAGLALGATLLLAGSGGVSAQVPEVVVYHGEVRSVTGQLFHGTLDVQVALHDSPDPTSLVGGVVWGPVSFPGLQVESGLLTLPLGGPSGPPMPASALMQGPMWLVLWIDGTLMQPFQAMSAAPYARVAETAMSLGGVPASGFVQPADLGPLNQQIAALQSRVDTLEAQMALANECCDLLLPADACLSSTPDGTPCDDANACTTGDNCLAGTCVGAALACDDGNPCTADGCDPASGCVHSPQSGSCDDGDPCTTSTCSNGACVSTPVDCDDGLSCTVDSCSGGACSNSLQAGFCLIGGACYGAGATNPAQACETCSPSLSTSAWNDANCSQNIDGLPFSGGGFDVSDDGGVTAAGWSSSAGVVIAQCYSGSGALLGSANLPVNPPASNVRTYVARADVTGQSVVLVFPWPTGGSPQPATTLTAYWLSPTCALTGGPVALPSTSQDLPGGHLEYFDVTMADNGRTAIVYQSRVGGGSTGTIRPTLAIFDGVGAPIAPPQHYGVDVCNQSGNGIRVAMRETTGDVIVTCQGHAWVPVRAQRFTAGGAPVDASMFEASLGAGSSWYDSHMVGMHDDGSFVVVWQNSGGNSLEAAFFSPIAAHLGTVTIGSGGGQWFDGYRNSHSRIEPVLDGTYLIPGPAQYAGLHAFARYTKSGGLVSHRDLLSHPPLLRVDGANVIYALSGGSVVKDQPPWTW